MEHERWYIEWSKCFSTNNLKLVVERLYQDSLDDKKESTWEGSDRFYIVVQEIITTTEAEKFKLTENSVEEFTRHNLYRKIGRELAFHGNEKFTDDIFHIAKTYDDFNTVIRAAFILSNN